MDASATPAREGPACPGASLTGSPGGPLAYARARQARFLAELSDFLRIPSISGKPRHAGDVRRGAAWLAEHLRGIGMQRVRIAPTARHPVVLAEWRGAPGRPTVLVYGHYDVQPVDPLDAWRTPPFRPVVREHELYARGASDDKGQLFTHVKAIEAWLRAHGRLPVNVVCLFEGEEEIGSPNLRDFLGANRDAVRADVAVISDTRIPAPDQPAITYALRGMLGLELEVRGPAGDLHSGAFGGAVHNPIQMLCEIIARLHDRNGRVAIPGFYDRVRAVSERERAAMRRSGPDDLTILCHAGVGRGWGEGGYTLYERTTVRPALTVNGITGGYQGPGGKGVIPARAVAKLGFRLVPEQDPREVERLFRRRVAAIAPAGMRVMVRTRRGAHPVVMDRRHPAMRAAAAAYWCGFGAAPVFLRSGGTIPVVDTLQRVLDIPTVLVGYGLPDDRAHAPNEKLHLPNFINGIATNIWFLWLVRLLTANGSRLTRSNSGPRC